MNPPLITGDKCLNKLYKRQRFSTQCKPVNLNFLYYKWSFIEIQTYFYWLSSIHNLLLSFCITFRNKILKNIFENIFENIFKIQKSKLFDSILKVEMYFIPYGLFFLMMYLLFNKVLSIAQIENWIFYYSEYFEWRDNIADST